MITYLHNLPNAVASAFAAFRAGAAGAPVRTLLGELGGDDHDAAIRAVASTVRVDPAPPGIRIDRGRALAPNQFINETTPKNKIGLHFTAGGTADGAIRTFANDRQRVATAYVVDTDGTVFELFPPEKWAYSFGIKHPAATAIERSTVAIEIVNWGPLVRRGDGLYAWPPVDERTRRELYQRRYCAISETSRYVHRPFRNVEYFAAYPAAQQSAVFALVEHLCERFDIPRRVVPAERLFGPPDVAYIAKFSGVFGHQHVREKTDPGPALDWARLDALLSA